MLGSTVLIILVSLFFVSFIGAIIQIMRNTLLFRVIILTVKTAYKIIISPIKLIVCIAKEWFSLFIMLNLRLY